MARMTLPRIVVLMFSSIGFLVASVWSQEGEDLVSSAEISVVVGRTAYLPCDTNSESNEDRVYMVLLFRQTGGKPIYSYDVRGRAFQKALEWSDPSVFGARASFNTNVTPTALQLLGVQMDDEGAYRCRVDFKNSPTKNYRIQLKVIVPPHKIVLYSGAGRVITGVIGPLKEGDNCTIFCEIRGGRPQPELIWLLNKTRLKNHTIIKSDGKIVVSKVYLLNAERSWLNSTVRCQANNTHLMSPHERTAIIEMRLRPTSVTILKKPRIVKAEVEIKLVCVIHGSRPPATVSWWKDNQLYNKGSVATYINDTSSLHSLMMIPYPEDDGTTFTCRAENSWLSVTMEDSFQMHVIYRPVVTATLGSTLNPNEIKEGDDVYFECSIKANPKERRISWLYDETIITGKHASTKSLVMQKVSKKDGGLYSCRAANSEGESTSLGVYLRVQHSPVCSHKEAIIVGVQAEEPVRIRCTVIADPADLTFIWQFNNSDQSFQVSPARFASAGGTSSELFYRAASDRDFGSILCSAKNSVGMQEKPCVFHIVQATRPQTPRNCTWSHVKNDHEDYLAVRCQGSYDYYMTQYYTLEALGNNYRVLYNTTDSYPSLYTMENGSIRVISGNIPEARRNLVFWLNMSWSSLDFFENEKLAVIARNSLGPSEPFVLKDYQSIYQELNQASPEEPPKKNNEFRTIIILAILAILLIILGIMIVLCIKKLKRAPPRASSKGPTQSVVQVDAQGRRRVVAVPTPVSGRVTRSTVFNRRAGNLFKQLSEGFGHRRSPTEEPPRVVLESANNNTYTIREVSNEQNQEGPPVPSDEVPQR